MAKPRNPTTFASVAERLRNATAELPPEQATRSIFALLQETMDPAQLRHVKEQPPVRVQQLFQVPARAAR